MTISTTAAIHRNPPQEVKSTCDGEKVRKRIKTEAGRGPQRPSKGSRCIGNGGFAAICQRDEYLNSEPRGKRRRRGASPLSESLPGPSALTDL